MSEHAILHEVGHAVAMDETYRFVVRSMTVAEDLNQLVAEMNRLGRRIPPGEVAIFHSIHGDFEEITETLQHVMSEMERAPQRSRVLTAYASLPDVATGPTRYGRTAIGESFADAFALYHLDPEALRRASPSAHGFFADQGHLVPGPQGELPLVAIQATP